MNTKAFYLPIVVESNEDGFLAHCSGVQGAFAEGDTLEEAIFNCIDVFKMIAAYRAERGETLGWPAIEMTAQTHLSFSIPIAVTA